MITVQLSCGCYLTNRAKVVVCEEARRLGREVLACVSNPMRAEYYSDFKQQFDAHFQIGRGL